MTVTSTPKRWAETVGHWLRHTLFGRVLVFLSLPLFLVAVSSWKPATQPPVFDAQVHYNEDSWDNVSVKAILATAKDKNIPWLLVGSLPNEGTWRLHEAAPEQVIPMVVPYRTRDERDTWFADPNNLEYLKKEINARPYRGIGEFFLFSGQVDSPVVRGMVELAKERNLVLHARSDEVAIGELFSLGPNLRILWAHGGMFTPPATIAAMLERYPKLWVEISHRGDVAPNGNLSPEWQDLMQKFPERVLLGSGTYNTDLWRKFRYYFDSYRGWLKQLPPALAQRIAFRNGLELFGVRYDDKGPEDR